MLRPIYLYIYIYNNGYFPRINFFWISFPETAGRGPACILNFFWSKKYPMFFLVMACRYGSEKNQVRNGKDQWAGQRRSGKKKKNRIYFPGMFCSYAITISIHLSIYIDVYFLVMAC